MTLVTAAAVMAWIVGFGVFASTLPRETAPLSDHTDAIVVLTGGTLRLEEGIDLLEAGVAAKLFVSGVHRGVDVAELLRLQNREMEKVACCIILGHDAANTVGNADETAAWVRAEGITSIRLVTAGYHMPRSLLEFRAAMPGVRIVQHPVTPDHVKHENWYLYPGTAVLIAEEFIKYTLVWLRQAWRDVVIWVGGTA